MPSSGEFDTANPDLAISQDSGVKRVAVNRELYELKEEVWGIMQLSMEFMILWFCANYFYNLGLANTTVSSSSVLCNTSSIFVYIIGLCLLPGIKFSAAKAFMVLFSFCGIVLVALSDQSGDEG
mmetsp:Transcript_24698/g.38436  ORF Transcript_24698/g.38436 Transcript_24698/m.38436 type:complete len:124 (+) Transcript_24698:391-762(+)